MTKKKSNKFKGLKEVVMSVSVQADPDSGSYFGEFPHCCGVDVVGGFGDRLTQADLTSDTDTLDKDDEKVTLANVVADADGKFLLATTRENQKLAAEELKHRGFKAVGVFKGSKPVAASKADPYVLTFWLKVGKHSK